MTEELTAADKGAIRDALVRELEKRIDATVQQVARVASTLTAENRGIYEDSINKSIQELREQIRDLRAMQLRAFTEQEAIAYGALVRARFAPAGRPATETWILIVPRVFPRRLEYKGHEIEVGDGSFGYGGSLLGLKAGESIRMYGDGRAMPDYSVEVHEVL